MVWNLFPFKGNFSFGKTRSSGASWAVEGLSHLSDLMFHQKVCRECSAWVGALFWRSCQSPVAHSYNLLNHLNSFQGGMLKLNEKCEKDLLLYSLSHFECDGQTVQMLTQQHLLLPLTSTVKSWLFMHVHSSPLSLAARLHRCHANHSSYIKNGWTFSGLIISLYI